MVTAVSTETCEDAQKRVVRLQEVAKQLADQFSLGQQHDSSKLVSLEEYYDSEEYNQYLKESGVALNHHTEHFVDGIYWTYKG